MISVIIPAMWFAKHNLINSVDNLTKLDIVGEIIVIHNNKCDYDLNALNQEKLVSIIPPRNIGCNPAWNIGAKLARFDKLFILNDDFEFDFSVCSLIAPHITSDKGLILSDTSSASSDTPIRLTPVTWPGNWMHGWACAFFIHRSVYLDNIIPEEIKVNYGDNWLLNTTGKPHYVLRGVSFSNTFSTTINRMDGLVDNSLLYIDCGGDESAYERLKVGNVKYGEHKTYEEIIL